MTRITKSRIADFMEAVAIRALRSFFQVFAAALPASGFALGEVNWVLALSVSAGAAVASIATSIATGLPEVDDGMNIVAIYSDAEGRHARRGDE
ncbi:MAG: hypothetical protein IJ087_00400 [Eggerthellaceae bacterium]|nr:hypothetical protein [Eggerthellaceae bacterium]